MTRVTVTLHDDLCTFISVRIILIMRNFQIKVWRKNTHLYSVFFFRKSCRLWNNVAKYGTVRQGHRRHCNTAHAHCMLDNKRLQTHIQNIYYLLLFHGNSGSATHLSVKLYI